MSEKRSTELEITEDQIEFNTKQLSVLGIDRAHPAHLATFFHQVRRTGLDPFARQIYMITRQGNPTIQTGIDGFRVIARRAVDTTGETLGYGETMWANAKGEWVDVWLQEGHPAAAKVTVYRNGQSFSAVALYSEYVALKRDGKPNTFWQNKAALMLAKCAEALALRKAFPQDLSGLYTSDEMDQADQARPATPVPARAEVPAQAEPVVVAPVVEAEPAAVGSADDERSELLDRAAELLGWSPAQVEAMVQWASSKFDGTQVARVDEMSEPAWQQFADYLTDRVGETEYGTTGDQLENAEIVE